MLFLRPKEDGPVFLWLPRYLADLDCWGWLMPAYRKYRREYRWSSVDDGWPV